MQIAFANRLFLFFYNINYTANLIFQTDFLVFYNINFINITYFVWNLTNVKCSDLPQMCLK